MPVAVPPDGGVAPLDGGVVGLVPPAAEPVALAPEDIIACVSVNFVSLAGVAVPVVPVAPLVPVAGIARSMHPVTVILLASAEVELGLCDGVCADGVCGDGVWGDDEPGACAITAIVAAHVIAAHAPDHMRIFILSSFCICIPRDRLCNVKATDDFENSRVEHVADHWRSDRTLQNFRGEM